MYVALFSRNQVRDENSTVVVEGYQAPVIKVGD
jgi:hypothetical protein